jgi:glycosyltransferase involved in cell wall biosynthesis
MWGVSIVICSHNGAGRLPATLQHLAKQRVPPGLQWEILLVDNASSDATAEVARRHWPVEAPARLRVAREERLGLTQARCRGLKEARFELVSFIDDDNWPAPDWVASVADLMKHYDDVGACGGQVEAAFESPCPPWFSQCCEYYAVGTQGQRSDDITWTRGYLWGAGLTIRKSAWASLTAEGFRFQLNDRAGQTMLSGGDAELCLALRLAGWKLWYEPRLNIRHFIPAGRLDWKYAKAIARGFGAAAPVLNAYAAIRKHDSHLLLELRSNWICQSLMATGRFVKGLCRCLLSLRSREGSKSILDMIYRFEILRQFLRMRKEYDTLCRYIQEKLPASQSRARNRFVTATEEAG